MKRKGIMGIRIEDRLRMIKIKDSLSGRIITRIGRNVLIALSAMLIICIIYLFLQIIGLVEVKNVVEETEAVEAAFMSARTGNATASSSYNPKDIMDVVLGVVTVLITGVTAFQVYMMKDIDHMEMSHKIYKDNQEYRKEMEKAKEQMAELAKALKNSDDFDGLYVQDKYSALRAFAFHYEYIGYLVFRNRLNFDIVFDTITFPNWLIASKEAQKIMKAGRKETPDFWNGAEHLYRTYEVKRKYNKLKDSGSLPDKKKARKEEISNRKTAYKYARGEWERHYCRLPN